MPQSCDGVVKQQLIVPFFKKNIFQNDVTGCIIKVVLVLFCTKERQLKGFIKQKKTFDSMTDSKQGISGTNGKLFFNN